MVVRQFGIGLAVAVLLGSGLANSWFLIGPDHLGALATSFYGRLLVAKVLLFGVMLAFAAHNRFRLTPRLAASLDTPDRQAAIGALRRSVILETLAGIGVLAIVAALGAMAPPSAQ